MRRASTREVARVLQAHSVHDPYLLVFGPGNSDAPEHFVLRVVLAVPEDRFTDQYWTANSLEQIGPLTHTVQDTALLLEVISGHDKRDSTSAPRPAQSYLEGLDEGVAGMKIGIPRE